MDNYTRVSSNETLMVTREEFETIKKILDEDIQEDGREHGLSVDYDERGLSMHLFDDCGCGVLENIPKAALDIITQALRRKGRSYWEIGIAHTADRNVPGTFGGTTARITDSGEVLFPQITWESRDNPVSPLQQEPEEHDDTETLTYLRRNIRLGELITLPVMAGLGSFRVVKITKVDELSKATGADGEDVWSTTTETAELVLGDIRTRLVRRDDGWYHNHISVDTKAVARCTVASDDPTEDQPQRDKRIRELEEELERTRKREQAIIRFCECEMNWEFFRAEMDLGDDASQSMQNAKKLREYLACHTKTPKDT